MALDKKKLGADLLAMMNTAKDQGWSPQQVAEAMAGAIDSYVRAGDIKGVQVSLPGGQLLTQTAAVHPS